MPVLGTQVIKSIQRGSTTGSGSTTINAVDLSKSFVSASFANGVGRGKQDLSGAGWAMSSLASGAALASTTSITITQGTYYAAQTSSATSATCYWEVIEYV